MPLEQFLMSKPPTAAPSVAVVAAPSPSSDRNTNKRKKNTPCQLFGRKGSLMHTGVGMAGLLVADVRQFCIGKQCGQIVMASGPKSDGVSNDLKEVDKECGCDWETIFCCRQCA